MWKTIKLKNIVFKNPVFLAPMAGFTDFPFRRIARKLGAGLVVSEMISSHALVQNNKKTRRMISTAEEEYPISVQIFGSDERVMSEAARIVQDMGAAIIDINMGCPQKKIVKSGAGAALMLDEVKAGRLMAAVCKAVTVSVTVKMRLGWDDESINAEKLARIAEDSGVSLITIHARAKDQMFSGNADWKAIKPIKEQVNIPVIANGDIKDTQDVVLCLKESSADGIMIGRGALGRPWIFKEILAPNGFKLEILEKYQIVRQHMEEIFYYYPPTVSLGITRKHLSWYSKGLKGGAIFRDSINKAGSREELIDKLDKFYNESDNIIYYIN